MPTINVVFLCIVIFAFIAFAVVLFWGDMQTRSLPKNVRSGARQRVSSH
jgi:hypothetical protein